MYARKNTKLQEGIKSVAESDDDLGIKSSLKISRYFLLTVWKEKWATVCENTVCQHRFYVVVCNYLFQ